MELTVMERITLMSVLPRQGNFLELTILRTLREKLEFSEEELEKGQIVITPLADGRTNWISKAPDKVIKDCNISEPAEVIITIQLKNLDKEKTLRPEHISLYEKFVLAKESPPADG